MTDDIRLPNDMAAYGGILMDTPPWLYADAAELRALYTEITEAQVAARTTVAALGRVHARLGTLKEKPTESDQDPFEPDCIEQAAIRRDEDGADTEQAPEGYEDDETGEGHS